MRSILGLVLSCLVSHFSMAAIPSLEGKWKGVCSGARDKTTQSPFDSFFYQDRFDCSKNECKARHLFFSDWKCSVQFMETICKVPYEIGKEISNEIYELDWACKEIKMILTDSQIVKQANDSAWAGHTDWALNKEKEVNGKTILGGTFHDVAYFSGVTVTPNLFMMSKPNQDPSKRSAELTPQLGFVRVP